MKLLFEVWCSFLSHSIEKFRGYGLIKGIIMYMVRLLVRFRCTFLMHKSSAMYFCHQSSAWCCNQNRTLFVCQQFRLLFCKCAWKFRLCIDNFSNIEYSFVIKPVMFDRIIMSFLAASLLVCLHF